MISAQHIQQAAAHLNVQLGCHASSFKERVLEESLARRMKARQLLCIDEYLKLLEEHPEELCRLRRECSPGLSWFFRDPASFDALRISLRQLLEKKAASGSVRIWVVGCSTGEEAYSLGILVAECLDGLDKSLSVRLFATDIDTDAIAIARTARYDQTISAHLSAERLQRFFEKLPNGYRVRSSIRRQILFSKHDVLADPPFRYLDLIACRNLLIYLKPEAQWNVLDCFHESLRAQGLLFLGPCSDVTGSADLFSPVVEEQRLFRRSEVTLNWSYRSRVTDSLERTRSSYAWPAADRLEELQAQNDALRSALDESEQRSESLKEIVAAREVALKRLQKSSDDLFNLLRGMNTEFASLDVSLKLQSFSSGLRRLFPGVAWRVGLPLAGLDGVEGGMGLRVDIDTVVRTLEIRERVVHSSRGRRYSVRIRPYRSHGNAVVGVLLTFNEQPRLERKKKYVAAD